MKTLRQISKVVLGGSLAAAAAMAPQAQAHGHGDADARIQMLEQQLIELKKQIADLKSHADIHHEKIVELDEWKSQAGEGMGAGGSMIFFRGGYSRLELSRKGEILPDAAGITGNAGGENGWYVGAGFEHTLSRDLFGLTEGTFLEGTDILGEVMFEYKRFAQMKSEKTNGVTPLEAVVGGAVLGDITAADNPATRTVTVTQFTLTAAPKIKFMRGSMIRPWIIPVGLGIHVISPPSNGVTVLNPGLMFGAGADINLFKNLYIGGDFRYHLTADEYSLGGIDGADTDGFTAGGYLGFSF